MPFPQYSSKVSTIYNCVDTQIFYRRSATEIQNIKKRLGLQTDKIILYIGRLVKEKAIDQILKAMPAVLRIEPETKLVIVGTSFFVGGKDTAHIAYLHKLAEPIKQAIVFAGYINNHELPALYSSARAFVTPVEWEDPSPKTIYEAAACATPIIATARGGIPEIVTNDESAILLGVEYTTDILAKTIIDLLHNPEIGIRLGKAARQRMMDTFDVQKITTAWEKVYE